VAAASHPLQHSSIRHHLSFGTIHQFSHIEREEDEQSIDILCHQLVEVLVPLIGVVEVEVACPVVLSIEVAKLTFLIFSLFYLRLNWTHLTLGTLLGLIAVARSIRFSSSL